MKKGSTDVICSFYLSIMSSCYSQLVILNRENIFFFKHKNTCSTPLASPALLVDNNILIR